MRSVFILLILTSFYLTTFGQNTDRLYPITDNALYGYIDETGKTIIKPQFLSAGQFSEGLAPVRLNGTYGYIDTKGKLIISPKFDFALPFSHGLAKVFIDGKPFFIDKQANIIFQHNYESISEFGKHSYAIVVTKAGMYGVINKSGKPIVPPVFAKINAFNNGVSVVTGLKDKKFSRDRTEFFYEKGVIDTLGNWIVRFGKYKEISEFKNGYARVEEITERLNGVIDETGKYRFTIPSKKWSLGYDYGRFYQGIAVVNVYSVDPDTVKVWSSGKRYDYKGAINSNGEIIFSNTDWDEITPFTFDRAFAQNTSGKWILIDRKGHTVAPQAFDDILYDKYNGQAESLFQNGMAFVETEKGWGAIDTTGKFVVEPRDLQDIEYSHLIRRGNIIFFQEDISIESDTYSYRYGFWNAGNNATVKPQFHDIDMNGFDNDLIEVMQDEKIGYINAAGQQIWKQQNVADKKQLNIDHMNRGYYYASSKYKKELAGLGGWGGSDNSAKQISANNAFSPNTLSLVIDSTQKTKWSEKFDAIKLFIANTSGDTLYFDAQDSRLNLTIQAQDRKGKWKDIEYLPSSWCGNSNHSLFLAPNELWEFATPVYEGEFKTKIRAKLLYKKGIDQENDNIIYSNNIVGYINPGQFWNKREYYPRGLMDPYYD